MHRVRAASFWLFALQASDAVSATAQATLDGDDYARLAYFGALVIFMASGLFARRSDISRDLKSLAVWIAALALLVALYGFKDEAKTVWLRFAGTLVPGLATGAGSEVSVTRTSGGMFVLQGEADGAEIRFVFDTGASSVVLTTDDAARAGIVPKEADFSITTSTANGESRVAPVILRELTIGPLRQTNVRAFVAKPGALRDSLLGHTFLDRLASYEVRGERLILRAK